LTKEVFTEAEMEGDLGRATVPEGKAHCKLSITEVLLGCRVDLEEVIRHEVGHLLGLHHSDDPSDVMYASHATKCQPASTSPDPLTVRIAELQERLSLWREAYQEGRVRCLRILNPYKAKWCRVRLRQGPLQMLRETRRELRQAESGL
jgi:hypothetical protein